MFKDAYIDSYARSDMRSSKSNQIKQKSQFCNQSVQAEGHRSPIELGKLRKKSEDHYMKTLLEDLSKLDHLMSNQDHPSTPISKEGDKFSCGSLLRKLSFLNYSKSNEEGSSSSLSSERTSKSRQSSKEIVEEKPKHEYSEEIEQSISRDSNQEASSRELSIWKQMKDTYRTSQRRSGRGSELFKDDTFMEREDKEEVYTATPKNVVVSNFDEEIIQRPHNNSFSIHTSALQKASSDRKSNLSANLQKPVPLSPSKVTQFKTELALKSDFERPLRLDESSTSQQGVTSKPKKSSLIERRHLQLLTISTKFEVNPSLENLRKSHQFYSALRPATWQVNSVAAALSSLDDALPFQIALTPISSPHALSLVQAFNASIGSEVVKCITPWPYLHFNNSKITNGDTRFKACQPIRSKQQQVLLLDHLKSCSINSVSSDHLFVSKELKKVDGGNFFRAVSGRCS